MPQVDKGIFILIIQSSLHLFFLTYGILFLYFVYPYFKNMNTVYIIYEKKIFDIIVILTTSKKTFYMIEKF
jgi:hypothetical protein